MSVQPGISEIQNLGGVIAHEALRRESGLPYLILPSRRNPKWLIPLANPDVAWCSLDLYTPARISGKFYKLFLRCLTQIGPVLKHQIIFLDKKHKTRLSKYVDSMSLSVGEKSIAISRGTISAREKLTLQIMDEAGSATAYMKVAKTFLARDALYREARMLRQIEKKTDLKVAPRLLRLFEADGNLVLAQTAGPTFRSDSRLDHRHWDFFHLLLDEGKMLFPKDFIIRRNWIARVDKIMGSMPLAQFDVLNQALAVLAVAPEKPIRHCLVHGDFVPWNIHYYPKNSQDSLYVFDWERGFTHGIPLFDACHFVVQFGILVQGWNPVKVLDQLELLWRSESCKDYLKTAEVEDDHLPLLVAVYFLEVLLDGMEIGEYPENSTVQKKRLLCLESLLGMSRRRGYGRGRGYPRFGSISRAPSALS